LVTKPILEGARVSLKGFARLSPLILGVAAILLAAFSGQFIGYRIETDKDVSVVGENVTASIVHFNNLPFPFPESGATRMEFGCTLNGEPLDADYVANINPIGDIHLMPLGSNTWPFPITVAPKTNGTLLFMFKIGRESMATYEKTVKVNPSPLFLEKPAWLMIDRFNAPSPSEPNIDPARLRIIDVDNIDFDVYPRLLEAFEVEEDSHPRYPHPYEWVNLTHGEGVEIVELFGGRYVARDAAIEDHHFDISYRNIYYTVTVVFSWEPPPID